MRADGRPRTLTLGEFLGVDELLLLDCEFTCWPGSIESRWADPEFPPELIEIALAGYDTRTGRIGETFVSLVRPSLHPELSAYCRGLLKIDQTEVDRASIAASVLSEIPAWFARQGLESTPTCEWGTDDRLFIAADAARARVSDPFAGHLHVDLMALFHDFLGWDTESRDSVRARCGLEENPGRHRALPDALDLARFCAFLRREATR